MSEYSGNRMKKEGEQEALNYFLDAYESITHEPLEVIEASERPDFICMRQDGERIGVELAKVRRGHPNDILWDKIIEKQNFLLVECAFDMIQKVANEKEMKRNEPDWKLSEAAMLLIELSDIPLYEIKDRISEEALPDLFSIGFKEVWLADFSELEVYDNVELFCIRPANLRGYYPRSIQIPYR